jgi:hypothetical protein
MPRTCVGQRHDLFWEDTTTWASRTEQMGLYFARAKLSHAEAEFGAAFQNAQKAAEFRNTLAELGYPQIATTLMIDNTVAEGLASDTINAKRSKSMDMRFFWLRDRIKKGQFNVKHLSGKWNIADFFTKSLPRLKFTQFFPYIAINRDRDDLPQLRRQKRKTITMAKTTS